MKNPFFKKVRNSLVYIFVLLLKGLIFFIPWSFGGQIGGFIGFVFYILAPKERNKIFRNLDIVYGKGVLDIRAKTLFAKRVCRNMGIGVFEFAKFSTWTPEKISSLVKEVEGLEYCEKAIREGKSYISITPHMSNWELAPIYAKCAIGWPRVGAIGKKIYDPRLERIVNSTRINSGYEIYDKDNISREMIRGLRSGKMILGILVDQDTTVESMVLPFLGIPAKTPIVPAILAKKYGTYIGTVFMIRRDDGYYRLLIKKPCIPDEKDTVESIALRYNDEISSMIRQYPEQWVWIHERWKSTVGKNGN
jgi:KDO2-lipid IV(A) lauroyltransferase